MRLRNGTVFTNDDTSNLCEMMSSRPLGLSRVSHGGWVRPMRGDVFRNRSDFGCLPHGAFRPSGRHAMSLCPDCAGLGFRTFRTLCCSSQLLAIVYNYGMRHGCRWVVGRPARPSLMPSWAVRPVFGGNVTMVEHSETNRIAGMARNEYFCLW